MAPILLHPSRAADDSDLAAPIPFRRLLQRWSSSEDLSSSSEPLPRSPASIFPRNSFSNLFGRQSTTAIIPASYGNIDSGPSPGTVVGAVLGSVAGFILLLWLFYTCMTPGGWWIRETTESEVIVRRPHKSRSSTRTRRASEKVEIRRERSRPETIIVEEERQRRSRSMSRSSASDEVVVIEEHSPPRKSKKKSRRNSGFRTVDPSAYGGVIGGNRRSR